MNIQEMQDLVDEACVIVGDGWRVEERTGNVIFLKSPDKGYFVSVWMRPNCMQFSARTVRNSGYAHRMVDVFKLPFTASSIKISQTLLLHVIPEMDEIQRVADYSYFNRERQTSDSILDRAREIIPAMQRPYPSSDHIRLSNRDGTGSIIYFGLRREMQTVSMNIDVPIELAMDVLRLLSERIGEL